MKLVICEKPSVAKAVASALGVTSRADGCFEGNGLIVSWCVGHLVSPMDAAGYDLGYKKWKYDDLPILPEPFRYVLAKDKEDAFQNLKRLMDREDVTELVNACDAGREGELIFRLVYEMAGCRKPFSRLWISSMEDAAIREGFAGLRPVVCANLPYNVTSPLLTAFLTAGCFDTVTVMIQREVARRLCARPGTADYGALTVFVQWHAEPEPVSYTHLTLPTICSV